MFPEIFFGFIDKFMIQFEKKVKEIRLQEIKSAQEAKRLTNKQLVLEKRKAELKANRLAKQENIAERHALQPMDSNNPAQAQAEEGIMDILRSARNGSAYNTKRFRRQTALRSKRDLLALS